MAWGRLDPDAPLHPKFIQAGPLAFALFCAGVCYAVKLRTDGAIPTGALLSILPGLRPRACVAEAVKLVEAGLWEVKDEGYQIHDFLKYNLSAADQREMDRVNYEKSVAGGRARSKAAVRVHGRFVAAPANDQPTTSPVAGPAHQPSTRLVSTQISSGRRNTKPRTDVRSEAFESFWVTYPRKVSPDAAWRAWKAKDCEASGAEILAAVERQRADLLRSGMGYCPHPATWLNGGRWKDEPPPPTNGTPTRHVNDAWAGKTTAGDVKL